MYTKWPTQVIILTSFCFVLFHLDSSVTKRWKWNVMLGNRRRRKRRRKLLVGGSGGKRNAEAAASEGKIMTDEWELTTAITAFDLDLLNVTRAINSSSGAVTSSTGGRKPRFELIEMVIIAVLSGLLSVATVGGNVMVMVSFKIDKQLQTISNYFLFSLAVADVTVGLVSMPLFTVYTIMGYWPLGAALCDSWLALDYLASNASVLNLLIISFDRYFSVTRPLTYRAKRSPVKAGFMISE